VRQLSALEQAAQVIERICLRDGSAGPSVVSALTRRADSSHEIAGIAILIG